MIMEKDWLFWMLKAGEYLHGYNMLSEIEEGMQKMGTIVNFRLNDTKNRYGGYNYYKVSRNTLTVYFHPHPSLGPLVFFYSSPAIHTIHNIILS